MSQKFSLFWKVENSLASLPKYFDFEKEKILKKIPKKYVILKYFLRYFLGAHSSKLWTQYILVNIYQKHYYNDCFIHIFWNLSADAEYLFSYLFTNYCFKTAAVPHQKFNMTIIKKWTFQKIILKFEQCERFCYFISIWEISYIMNYWTNYYLILSKILQILKIAIEVFFPLKNLVDFIVPPSLVEWCCQIVSDIKKIS